MLHQRNWSMNSFLARIHRFLWWSWCMIEIILDDWSWSGSSKRNAVLSYWTCWLIGLMEKHQNACITKDADRSSHKSVVKTTTWNILLIKTDRWLDFPNVDIALIYLLWKITWYACFRINTSCSIDINREPFFCKKSISTLVNNTSCFNCTCTVS